MASFFDFVKAPSLKKYEYDLSHDVKLSSRIGDLVPFNWEYLCPGDSVQLNSQIFMRTAPLIHPIFQRLNVDVHHFFIPLRLVWEDFETFITGFNQKTGETNDNLKVPQFILPSRLFGDTANALFDEPYASGRSIMGVGSLTDYLGFPSAIASGIGGATIDDVRWSLLPYRAYTQVFNDYYRDSIKEPIIDFSKDSLDISISDIDDLPEIVKLRTRALAKDYFTTSQPTPQLGEDVSINMPNSVIGHMNKITPTSGQIASTQNLLVTPTTDFVRGTSSTNSPVIGLVQGAPAAVITTINKLRELFSLQKWADTGNKFGSRYREQTLGHFGVETPDARLQRAQYLGGGRTPVMINQVSQLSESSADFPLGYQAGQGMASGADNYFNFEAREHGILLSIISVLPENTYYKGIPKKFLLTDRFDFPFPEFATIGEQEVSSREMNILNKSTSTFGYQERYAEFKTIPNRASGEFTTSLRNFFLASPQVSQSCLDTTDLRVSPEDYDNVFPTESQQADNLYFLISNDFKKQSPLPYINRVTTDYV